MNDDEIELNRIKINAVASKTPIISTKITMKKKGLIHSNTVSAIPDTGAEMTVAGKNLI